MVVATGLMLTAVPLVTGRLPGVIMPVPLTNTPVRFELAPPAIVVGLATKLVIDGAVPLNVTVVIWLINDPIGFVTVRV